MRRVHLGIPQPIVPVFWGLALLEAAYGAYLGIWPLWIERLGAPIAIVGLILGAAGFLRIIVLAPSAALADRIGYRRAILASRAAAVFGLLGAALATHWTHLFVLVVGAAIGELVFPLLQSLVAAQAGDQRMRSFALVFTVGPSVALAIGPLLSGALVLVAGMRAAFVLAALLAAGSLYFFAKIEEPAGIRHRDMDQQSSYRAALGDTRIRMITGLLVITVFSLSLGVSLIPTFLEDQRGYRPATIATLAAFAAVGSAIFGIAVARLRNLQRAPFIGVAIAVGFTALALLLFHSTAALLVVMVAFVFRGGLFSAWAMLNAALGEAAPAHHRARGFALAEMAGGLAVALGPIVAGLLYAQRATLPFELAIALAVGMIPVLVLAQRRANGWSAEPKTPLPVETAVPMLEPETQTPA